MKSFERRVVRLLVLTVVAVLALAAVAIAGKPSNRVSRWREPPIPDRSSA